MCVALPDPTRAAGFARASPFPDIYLILVIDAAAMLPPPRLKRLAAIRQLSYFMKPLGVLYLWPTIHRQSLEDPQCRRVVGSQQPFLSL
jgi:hypothetical protein